MEVAVDGEKKSLRPRAGDNKHIDLSGLLYFGGIEPGSKKQRAVDQGKDCKCQIHKRFYTLCIEKGWGTHVCAKMSLSAKKELKTRLCNKTSF